MSCPDPHNYHIYVLLIIDQISNLSNMRTQRMCQDPEAYHSMVQVAMSCDSHMDCSKHIYPNGVASPVEASLPLKHSVNGAQRSSYTGRRLQLCAMEDVSGTSWGHLVVVASIQIIITHLMVLRAISSCYHLHGMPAKVKIPLWVC